MLTVGLFFLNQVSSCALTEATFLLEASIWRTSHPHYHHYHSHCLSSLFFLGHLCLCFSVRWKGPPSASSSAAVSLLGLQSIVPCDSPKHPSALQEEALTGRSSRTTTYSTCRKCSGPHHVLSYTFTCLSLLTGMYTSWRAGSVSKGMATFFTQCPK